MSPPTSTETSEARELTLVGQVELRIALAKSDSKLESILSTYLPPLLLKLASSHLSVRNKVISVCQHINTRIQTPSIKLPVAALLAQYKEKRLALIRHFDLLYIQQGIDRLTEHEQEALLPLLIHGIRDNYDESRLQAANLYNLVLRLLHSLILPQRGSGDDDSLREKFGLRERPEDAAFLAVWLGKLILYSDSQNGLKRCPGLSIEDCEFLKLYGKEKTWEMNARGGMKLFETKVVAIRFLASGAFLDSERFLPALFASADPNSRLSEIGDDILKRTSPSISLEEHQLLKQLFAIYLGSSGDGGALPARPLLQTKILGLLCKSKNSSTFIQQAIQVVHDGLATPVSEAKNGISSPAKQGLEASKLQAQIFTFVNWLAQVSPQATVIHLAPTLVYQLRNYIENQGWPQLQNHSSRSIESELKSRKYAYESLGTLAASCPEEILLKSDLGILNWLFTSLGTDPSGNDVSLVIEQAVGSVIGAFDRDLNSDVEEALAELLLRQMNLYPGKEDDSPTRIVRSTRSLAVRFANRCLPYGNVTARWICIRALNEESDDRRDVKEEGRKGLDPYWYRISNPSRREFVANNNSNLSRRYDFPAYSELTKKFFDEVEWTSQDCKQSNIVAFGSAIAFCRSILLHQILSSVQKAPLIDAEWARNIDALVANDDYSRAHIKSYLRQNFEADRELRRALERHISAAFDGIISQSSEDENQSGDCLLDLCTLGPEGLFDGIITRIPQLETPIFSNHKSTRDSAAHIFGLLASRKGILEGPLQILLDTLSQKSRSWRQAIGSEVYQVHGAVLATAYFVSRTFERHKLESKFEQSRINFIASVLDMLNDSRDNLLLEAAIAAISQLSLFATLSLDTLPPPHSILKVVQKLKDRSKTGDDKAIIALGYIAMQCSEAEPREPKLEQILDILYDLHEVRQPEVHFAVGGSLACAAAGWNSKSLLASFDIQGPPPPNLERRNILPMILNKILTCCKSTKPAMRQASVIWLLCIIQFCGHIESVQTQLRQCQAAFKGFLADRDSLNQESASRGLMLVYEMGDKTVKDELIKDLIASFTGTRTSLAGNVSGETELFEPGALPTGEGSVSTYNDIMSLASEVGDPSLVYRFMSLASNNAIWSSRAAFGRFGLSNLLSSSSIDGYLAQNPKLYPALFRYRFDPNTNVRSSMNEIWSALVKEPAVIVGLHFDSIMKELLKHILGREWRVRQASCAAIADLVQGRAFEKYEKYIDDIWTKCFKVCDDIKDSVRAEAMKLAKVLTGILTRSLKATDTQHGSANSMLKKVMPFLLSPSGLESSARDIQAYALSTLLEIIKSSDSKTLRPFIPDLVNHLLGLLSSFEPDVVNYIRLNAHRYDISTEQIDDVRLSNVRGSPMMEAIDRCLDLLDELTMDALAPSLENAIKAAIGLPSKVGCTRVLVSLSTRHNYVFKNYANRFLRLARKQVLDRNDTVSSAFAVSCGYLARLASEQELLNLVQHCQQLYFESEDDRSRKISGDVVYAISKHANDRFNSIASKIVPFVFIAKHDVSADAKAFFEDTWNESVGGSRAVLLYLEEILFLATKHLECPRWAVKHTCALSIADAATSSGSNINDYNSKMIWLALEKALDGKTWAKKEKILHALVRFIKDNSNLMRDEKVANQIQAIVFRESNRKNPVYRQYALASLGDFVEVRRNQDLFASVCAITKPIIEELLNASDEMDIDLSSENLSSKLVAESTLTNSMKALLNSINPELQSDAALTSNLTLGIKLSAEIMRMAGNKAARDAIYDGHKALFERLSVTSRTASYKPFEDALISCAGTMFDVQECVEQTRMKAAEASLAMAPLASHNEQIKLALRAAVGTMRTQERSVSVQQCLDRAIRILEQPAPRQGA